MKLTKKAAALLLAASLAVSVCAMPVFAASTTPETGSHEGSNETGKTSANTVVTYQVDCSYTWTIPKKIDFGENAGVNQTRIVDATADKDDENKAATNNGEGGKGTVPVVQVTSNIIDDDKTLHISIDTETADGTTYDPTDKKFYVVTGTTDPTMAQKLYFEITKSGAAAGTPAWDAATQPVLTVPAGTPTGKQELRFTLNTANGGTAEKAGTYNGKVVFKSELKPTT